MTTYPARPSGLTPLATTSDWEKLIASMGIFDGIDAITSMVPSLIQSPRQVQITPGFVVIKGQVWQTDANLLVPVPAQGASDRMDMLVLRLDRTNGVAANIISPQIITNGNMNPPTPSQTPTAYWEIPVCQWYSRSSGALDTLTDVRNFGGREVLDMLSTARPNPPHMCIGFETDTGYVIRWDGTVWRGLGPKTQVVNTITKATSVSPTYTNLHTPYAIGANDVNTTLAPICYRLRAGGYGVQSTGTPIAFDWQVSAFGTTWGYTSDTGSIQAGKTFNWSYWCELIVNSDGSASYYGAVSMSQAQSSPGALASTDAFYKQVNPGGVNIANATTMGLQVALSAAGAGGPYATCIGSTFERIAN